MYQYIKIRRKFVEELGLPQCSERIFILEVELKVPHLYLLI